MKRNVSSNNAAVEKVEKKNTPQIKIPDKCMDEFVKAVKIGYYKEFYKQGLITAEQLEQLIAMQNNKEETSAA